MRFIFDLFGTLVRSLDEPHPDHHWRHAATRLLEVDADAFTAAFRLSIPDRERGQLAFVPAVLAAVSIAGGRPDITQAEEFLAVSVDLLVNHLDGTLRSGAVEVLRALRDQGAALSLLTNASKDAGLALRKWSASCLFDRLVVSADATAAKPDVRAYATAGARPGDVYVGDGGSDELAGALRAGLIAVQIPELHWDGSLSLRPGLPGLRIADLRELEHIVSDGHRVPPRAHRLR